MDLHYFGTLQMIQEEGKNGKHFIPADDTNIDVTEWKKTNTLLQIISYKQ